jgi:class 3 adenylate cyclase/tetratricopeptide (TPR) repeat protein
VSTTRPLPDWLDSIGLGQYAGLFQSNEVDFETLRVLTAGDLEEMGLPFGPRKRLLHALSELDARSATLPPAAAPAPTDVPGERRQLTALFCDMVGFTELASRVDPEVLQEIIRRYEDACTVCIVRFEGYVFQRLGDGIVAFFGFPLAHEGEADRAIRAGLAILEAMARLEVPEVDRLKVRIGIATGVVVVSSAEKGAVGETMNLAARLQAIAEPGTLAVSERVRRVAGGAFDYADLGEQTFKGIAKPTRAYRVVGVSTAASRFEAATGSALAPLIGRDDELTLLMERWRLARGGRGQIVRLSGEAGIGKSRIVDALRSRLSAEGGATVAFQCSPYHVNSAFHPITDAIERLLAGGRADPGSRLDALESMALAHGRPVGDVAFVAGMLSIPYQDRYGALAMSPRRVKDETIRALVDLAAAAAGARPTALLLEDAHWADPTTLDVLDRLIARVPETPLLVVVTHRPEFQPRWSENGTAAAIALTRLSRTESVQIVSRLTGGRALPGDLLDQIVAKTDGVPLFVEELTKTILESGDLKDEGDRFEFASAAADMAIPATLRDSLTARLDRVKAVKDVAQIGAVIGRGFSYELIAAVAPMSREALDQGLAQLVESGLAHQQGSPPQATFTFKHALVQDAAYDSLLKSRRVELHGTIARTLDERFPAIMETAPETLAHHYTAAGITGIAVRCWARAGELALKRFALQEAGAHLRRGLALIEGLPPGADRDQTELLLRTLLGPAVVAHRGWAQSEVGRILEPAWALASSLTHRPAYTPVLHALWVHYLCRDQLATSLEWAEKLLAAGTEHGDDGLRIVGHRAASASYFWLGDFAQARRHGDRVQSLYDAERHWHIASLTNTDPLTGEGIYRAQYLWMLGYPDQAVTASDARDDHARRRKHPFDLAFALTLGAQAFDLRSEPERLLSRTEEAERVGREHGVPLLSEVMAEISRGIAWLRAGRADESVTQLHDSIARLMATGHRVWVWYLRALEGEALARSGDLDGALALVEDSLEQNRLGEQRAHLAEILRLRGWVLMQMGRPAEAEPSLREALDVARAQQARSWELRASTTLAGLLADRGDRAGARDLLQPIYGWFTEGFDTNDLREARALLDRLEG